MMERKVCGAHFGKFRALRRGAALRRTVTDEGSPPEAGLTAACTFANSVHGGGSALASL